MSSRSRLLPYGDHAVLVELDSPDRVHAVAAAAGRLEGVAEVVPGARTVLVIAHPTALDAVRARLSDVLAGGDFAADADDADSAPTVTLDVRYDGPDLADTATELGLDTDALVRAHSSSDLVVAFCGFSPGFAYLTGTDPALHVSRHPEPRTRVPAGSVAIAGEFSAVYPRSSPGGWRLLGTTDAVLWDLDHRPPALLVPGTRVRFRAV